MAGKQEVFFLVKLYYKVSNPKNLKSSELDVLFQIMSS